MFAAFLILTIGTTAAEYPCLPRHLTIASSLGVGIPAFFLALAPRSARWQSTSFLRDVARFAAPGGLAAGTAVLTSYLVALHVLGLSTVQARTLTTTVLLGALLFLIVELESRSPSRRHAVEGLVAVMAAGYALVLAIAPVRRFFALAVPDAESAAVALAGIALAVTLAVVGLRATENYGDGARP